MTTQSILETELSRPYYVEDEGMYFKATVAGEPGEYKVFSPDVPQMCENCPIYRHRRAMSGERPRCNGLELNRKSDTVTIKPPLFGLIPRIGRIWFSALTRGDRKDVLKQASCNKPNANPGVLILPKRSQ